MTLGLTPLGARVVIQADREDNAPRMTASGVLLATNLTAAVEGADAQDSWFVGTVIAVGPLVNHFNCRPYVQRRLDERATRRQLVAELARLPTDCLDPLQVGDRVTFSWSAGQELTLDGTKYLLMAASDVLAVLDKDEHDA